LLIVERHRAGWPQAHIAKAMGVSRKCVKSWLDRYATEGEAGLRDRSSRPRRTPTQTSTELELRIVELRRSCRRGPDWIGAELAVPARTVSRVLARHQVPKLSALDPMTGQLIRSSKVSAVRYERQRPGELVHLDVKKIGRIPDGGGWRAGVLPHGGKSAAQKKLRIGYDYVHAAVDDHSRLAYAEILGDEKGTTAAGFLLRAAAFFAGHGITHIEQVITDNAFAYRHSTDFRTALTALGARQRFIKPHCPWQNGKVEPFNRTLQTEWAYRQVFTSNTDRANALDPWLNFYNTQRRHSALGGLPPINRLLPT
jgi:transposase InsO family protein